MYLVIILLPALSFITVGLIGIKSGKKGAQLITTCLSMISCFLAIIGFYEVGIFSSPVSIKIVT